jgi:hypothetical protein
MTATCHLPQITCARCGDPIAADGPYVAITVHRERMCRNWLRPWRGRWVVHVLHAQNAVVLHESCADEPLTRAVANTINDTLVSTR